MTQFDFQARTELYLGSDWHTATAQGARPFPTAAHAIRFALEQAAPVSLHGARLIIGAVTYSSRDIGALYWRRDYPFARKLRTRTHPTETTEFRKQETSKIEHVQLRRRRRTFPQSAVRENAGHALPALQYSV